MKQEHTSNDFEKEHTFFARKDTLTLQIKPVSDTNTTSTHIIIWNYIFFKN
jgi:hypothetical protein